MNKEPKNMSTEQTENKMGVMPINRLLLSMSVPMMISMLVQALYNIVDSIFVARLNENALTAVSLAFPVQNLMIAVAVGTGVGVNALLSRSLGEKNQDVVNKTASNSLLLFSFSCQFFNKSQSLFNISVPVSCKPCITSNFAFIIFSLEPKFPI